MWLTYLNIKMIIISWIPKTSYEFSYLQQMWKPCIFLSMNMSNWNTKHLMSYNSIKSIVNIAKQPTPNMIQSATTKKDQSATTKRYQYSISWGWVLDKNKHQGFPVTFKVGGWGLVGMITSIHVITVLNCLAYLLLSIFWEHVKSNMQKSSWNI